MDPAPPDQDIMFGRFRLASRGGELRLDGAVVPLGGRALDLLLVLARSDGRLMTKDSLMEAVWPGRVVEENNLTVQITALRRALAQGGGERLIQTVTGRGYRFLVHTPTARQEAPPAPEPQEAPATRGAMPVTGSAQTMPMADMPVATMPVAPPPLPAHALPLTTTPFIGREGDLTAVVRLLRANRLVTVAGAGGIGKTRLALKVAELCADDFPDGMHFIDLAGVADPATVADTIGRGVGLAEGGRGGELLESVLRAGRRLMILDNCEHLIATIGMLARQLCAACRGLAILVTSREPLGATGEQIYLLPPLAAPHDLAVRSAADALEFDSVRLLVDRATAGPGGFALSDANAAAVADICVQLDGLPLAIEMAAGKLRLLSPAQLATRLGDRFRLLSGPRDAVGRHRTLAAMLDWSWELLVPSERRLLARMAVFAGSWGVDALLAIAGDPEDDEISMIERMAGLVDKSLVIADMTAEQPRGRLLLTTRHYAAARAAETAEPEVARRHAAFYADRFLRAQLAWPSTPTGAWLSGIAADADNLRAAIDWSFGPQGDTALALRLVAASTTLWWELPQLPLREGRTWFELAAARIDASTPPQVAARIWFGLSWREAGFGDRENLAPAEKAAALFRAAGEPVWLGAALWRAGSALLGGDTVAAAVRYLDDAERVLRAAGQSKWLALVLIRQADLRFRAADTEAALRLYREGLDLAARFDHWFGRMTGGSNMAELLFHLGDGVEALYRLRRLHAELAPGRRTPLAATYAAHLVLAGDREAALAILGEVVEHAAAIGMRAALAWGAEALALLLSEAGAMDAAARLAGHALAVHPSVATRAGARREVQRRLAALLDAAPDATARAAALAEGAGWGIDEAAGAAHAALAMLACAARGHPHARAD